MTSVPTGAHSAVEELLDQRMESLEQSFDAADGLAIYGPLEFGVDDVSRRAILALKEMNPSTERRLVLLIDTGGGYIEVVKRIVDTVRRRYKSVECIVPNSAFSAGTILAMAADSILMDDYALLGPIDPQVEIASGDMVPALGYLNRYNALLQKANEGKASEAEVQLLIYGFDQAQLYKYEEEGKLSVALLEEWLSKYKFKNWDRTETRGLKVTDDMRRNRANEIATALQDTDRWHSHGTGIGADTLRGELNLMIDDFGERKDLIAQYHQLLADYMSVNGIIGAVHARTQFLPYHVH